jgi:hypothetical protein
MSPGRIDGAPGAALAAVTPSLPQLTESQQVAVARLRYAISQKRSLALLAGPAGSGCTTVLTAVAEAAVQAGRNVQWTMPSRPLAERTQGRVHRADLVLCDDGHEADVATLSRHLDEVWRTHPEAAVVLAGRGRLLTLVARDTQLAGQLRLRAVLTPLTLAETAVLWRAGRAGVAEDDAVIRTVQEITAGIPRCVTRLREIADVLTQANPHRPLVVDDIEAIQRRLLLEAA